MARIGLCPTADRPAGQILGRDSIRHDGLDEAPCWVNRHGRSPDDPPVVPKSHVEDAPDKAGVDRSAPFERSCSQMLAEAVPPSGSWPKLSANDGLRCKGSLNDTDCSIADPESRRYKVPAAGCVG